MHSFDTLLHRMTGKRVYIDTNILIYFFNKDEKFFSLVSAFLEQCSKRYILGVVSELVIAEIMVQPYRERDIEVLNRLQSFFGQKNFFHVSEHQSGFISESAMIAGERGMKLIDAMHFQAALTEHCEFFITHDGNFRSTSTMEVVQLKDYLGTHL